MKLKKKDKEILKSMGYLDWDIQQIEAASNYTSYKVSETDKTISEEEALELLERKAFLSGMARSTFSATSYRNTLNETSTIMIKSIDFFLSKERKDIYECFKEAVEFLEWYDDDEYDTTTLYFKTSPRFLAFTNQDHEEITCAEISLEFPRNMKSLKDTSVEISQNLLDLRKDKVELCLQKKQLLDRKARVAVVLDYSGSMRELYQNGTVQATLERLLPIALNFDDNGAMEVWIFENSYRKLPDVTLQNYYGYVEREILRKGFRMGGTNYAPVMKAVVEKYIVEEPESIADYVIFITDGDCSDRTGAKEELIRNSKTPIFWQFVGIGGARFDFLQRLDEMSGRYVDNANFFALNDILDISDDEIYDRLLKEFPSWLKQPKVESLIQDKYRGELLKKGFFSSFFH